MLKHRAYLKIRIQQLCRLFAFFIIIVPNSTGQISLLNLQNEKDISYKKALKQSRSTGSPVVAILYSPSHPTKTANRFTNAKAILQDAGVTPVVIDWANKMNQKPQKKVKVLHNPMWLYIHPDDIIINGQYQILTDEQLKEFLTQSRKTHDELEAAIQQKKSSNSLNDLIELAKISAKTVDEEYISKLLNEYLKRANPIDINNKALQSIIRIASQSPVSKRVYRMITDRKERSIALTSADTVYNILQANIYADLKLTGQLYPYDVWQRYERELGFKADSLYRIFAIKHFSEPPIDRELLYNECFDFINIYPRASWALLDVLYSMVVPSTTKKEDLEILLDLISFQIFRDESYRQLDYKALILYKLGEKERALAMVAQIQSKAAEKNLKYQSMLYSIKK